MTQTTVSATPPPVTPPPVTPPVTPPPVDPAIQRQIDELKAAIGEKDSAIQFLTEQAKTRAAPPKTETPADDEDDADVLDLITSKGSKGLEKLLEKRGFVRAKDVDERVDAKANALVKEQHLIKTYPELEDKSSEFFKTTAQHYGNLVKAQVAPALAMEMAAERAELQLIREGKRQTPQQKTDAEKTEREAERRARISAQGGDKGVRAAREAEEDDELSDQQKHIARSMGITEDAYKARAKQGVSVRGTR
jgi:hypothetical protein